MYDITYSIYSIPYQLHDVYKQRKRRHPRDMRAQLDCKNHRIRCRESSRSAGDPLPTLQTPGAHRLLCLSFGIIVARCYGREMSLKS
ncbi:hypothetical protein RSAG8_03005, partial [Rhizoctonia solani AG-8 WAC10335]